MKGLTILNDEKRNKKIAQIDIDLIEKYDDSIQDLFDVIIAVSRKHDKKIPLAEVKRKLQSAGKL